MDNDLFVGLQAEVEEKYLDFFGTRTAPYSLSPNPEEVMTALKGKKRSFAYKDFIGRATALSRIESAVREERPLTVRVAWGYGKDSQSFRSYGSKWWKPDMADVFSLGVIGSLIKGSPYPIDLTITGSWDRYLNVNFYSLGLEPDSELREGLDGFSKEFKCVAAELLPGARVSDTYELSRNAGIEMDDEVEREWVDRELDEYKKSQWEYLSALRESVAKHSVNPERSMERYLRERIVERRYGVGKNDITIQFASGVPGSLQYLSIPNRRALDTVPPWSAKGGFLVNNGSWIEKMISPLRIKSMGNPDSADKFTIMGIGFEGFIYERPV